MAAEVTRRELTAAAENGGMDRQTLRDRVHRHKAQGLAGLVDRPLPGRTPMLNIEQMPAARRSA